MEESCVKHQRNASSSNRSWLNDDNYPPPRTPSSLNCDNNSPIIIGCEGNWEFIGKQTFHVSYLYLNGRNKYLMKYLREGSERKSSYFHNNSIWVAEILILASFADFMPKERKARKRNVFYLNHFNIILHPQLDPFFSFICVIISILVYNMKTFLLHRTYIHSLKF